MLQVMNNQDRLDPEKFCYWLQGFIEMSGATSINEEQMKVLREHLELVFAKVAVQQVAPHWTTPQTTITVPGNSGTIPLWDPSSTISIC